MKILRLTDNSRFPDNLINKVVVDDAFNALSNLPDYSVDAVITDPVWPDCAADLPIPGKKNPYALWALVVPEIIRISERLIVILGCNTDPRFLQIPASFPFVRVVWLRRVPSAHRGPYLIDADVAYVFGKKHLPPGRRQLPGFSTAVLQCDYQDKNPHPCKRHLDHMKYLVSCYTGPGDIIVDPFCGSGQTLLAARLLNRRYFGCDIKPEFVEYANSHLAQVDSYQTDFDIEKLAQADKEPAPGLELL